MQIPFTGTKKKPGMTPCLCTKRAPCSHGENTLLHGALTSTSGYTFGMNSKLLRWRHETRWLLCLFRVLLQTSLCSPSSARDLYNPGPVRDGHLARAGAASDDAPAKASAKPPASAWSSKPVCVKARILSREPAGHRRMWDLHDQVCSLNQWNHADEWKRWKQNMQNIYFIIPDHSLTSRIPFLRVSSESILLFFFFFSFSLNRVPEDIWLHSRLLSNCTIVLKNHWNLASGARRDVLFVCLFFFSY